MTYGKREREDLTRERERDSKEREERCSFCSQANGECKFPGIFSRPTRLPDQVNYV